MRITTNQQNDNCALLKLNGRLEGAAYPTLKRACAPWFRKAGVRQIRLDLRGVDGLGPGALGALLVLAEQAVSTGKTLHFLGGRDEIRRTLEAAGLRVFGRVA